MSNLAKRVYQSVGRHFVTLSCVQGVPSNPSEKVIVFSGFLVDVDSVWFYVTAGHILKGYLVDGLQPLYYAAECIDEKLPEQVDTLTASRLLEVIDRINHFLEDHEGRDSGGHIRRRLTSIRGKLGG